MTRMEKGRSPFYPGHPVPAELFIGRSAQIEHILVRGAGQVALGKPVSIFVQGEYGIGKSSIANFVQRAAEREFELLRIYANLGGCGCMTDVAEAILKATLKANALKPSGSEKIRHWLARYIGKQQIFGFTFNLEALKKDSPQLSSPADMLAFLAEARKRLMDDGVKGIFLVLDEINGISSVPEFAHFIKGLVDQNTISDEPVPLLLMLCGVEERRRKMIENHQPVERIFDVVDIEKLSDAEMADFFSRAFESVGMTVEDSAMKVLTRYSAGFPKVMHIIGDAAFWIDGDGIIKLDDAHDAVMEAAEEVGKKYVDQQVYRALRSSDYRSILDKIGKLGPSANRFTKAQIVKDLTESEKIKFNNFLQRMKKLRVIMSGENSGEYEFRLPMVRFYIWLESMSRE